MTTEKKNMHDSERGHDIVKSGIKEDAGTVDKIIDSEGLFKKISISNDGSSNLIISIDEDSTDPTNNTIVIRPGEVFDANLRGTELHYSAPAGTTNFRYLLEVY